MAKVSSRESMVERSILILDAGLNGKRYGPERLSMSHFAGGVFPILEDSDLTSDGVLFPMDVKPSDVSRTVDISIALPLSGDNSDDLVGLCAVRVRRRSAKQLRGKIPGNVAAFPLFEFGISTFEERAVRCSGQFVLAKTPIGWKRLWPPLFQAGVQVNSDHNDVWMRNVTQVALGHEFIIPFHWSITLSFDGGVPVKYFTDAGGAADVFRLRDVPPGRKRRSALRTWIRQHWREKRDGGLSEVVRHMRGATEFEWNGVSCKLQPSEDDMRELEHLREVRHAS